MIDDIKENVGPDATMTTLFKKRFPNQGFEKDLTPTQEGSVFMWATIFTLAKLDRLSDIRPDILVSQFTNLSAIADHYIQELDTDASIFSQNEAELPGVNNMN